jgi:hypothetical protein
MSFTALRHVAMSSRRTYTVGDKLEAKRPEGAIETRAAARAERTREADGSIAVEPHWLASIELATD